MNDRQLLERLAAEDTFRSDSALPSAAWDHKVAFAEVERLIALREDSAPVGRITVGGWRVGWRVTAAAFAVVMLIGAVVLLVTRVGEVSRPAATTIATVPPTTATQAPAGAPLSQETQQLLAVLERAYNRGDGAAVGAVLAPDPQVSLASRVDAAVSPSAGSLPERAATGDFFDERLRFADCLDFEGQIVCQVELTDEFGDILDIEPWLQTWRIELSGALIERIEVTGDDPVRAAAMNDFDVFVAGRTGTSDAGLLAGDLEWNRTSAGQTLYREWVVLFTALTNGVSEEALQMINDFHATLNVGDVPAAEALFVPGGQYRPIEAEDVLSASVYPESEVIGEGDLSDYFTLWYTWLDTDWAPVGCSGDAIRVTCTVESRGLMTLILPGQVARGLVTYTLSPEGIVSVVDRTVRTGGANTGFDFGLDLREFWRSWMLENRPELELMWPGGNGDPVNGFDLELVRAIVEFYPQFLVEQGVAVPPEYLDGSLLGDLAED